MSTTVKTGLIERLTQKALDGNSVTMSDVVEVAKLLDANSVATAKAINRLDKRIDGITPKNDGAANDAVFEQKVIIFLGLPTIVRVLH